MSIPPDKMPRVTRKTSVGEVLAALKSTPDPSGSAGTMAASKSAYEAGLARVKADIDEAVTASADGQLPIEKLKAFFDKKYRAMLDLAAAGDHAKALAALSTVVGAATVLNAFVSKYLACKKALYEDGNTDRRYLAELNRNSPPSDATRDALAKYNALMRLFHAGKYDECMAAFSELRKGIAALKKAVAEADKIAQPKAEAAAKKFEALAGGKKLSALGTGEARKLVEELKKLPSSEQTAMLADLHGTSGKLDAEGRLMQRAMYKAMTLDEKFKKEDQKKRDAYRGELSQDTDLQDAVADWNAKDSVGQDKVSAKAKQKVFETILAVQSKVYGIPVPAIQWYAGDKGDFGGFDPTSGIISLNTRYLDDPEEMINTILHENSHNFQDQLVKRFFEGAIPKSDPMYEQAKTFAVLHHWDAYVEHDEDAEVYQMQPEEMQAWDAGDIEAPKLMQELAAAKAKRESAGP